MKDINSWASGVIVSVIIATLIEMILPESKNKKYIKTIIGIFILFSIIAPVISKISNEEINLSSVLASTTEYEYPTCNEKTINTEETILETYKSKLKEEIINNLEEKGYQIDKIDLDIDSTKENYGKINKIQMEISKKEEIKTVETVNKIEININDKKESAEKLTQSITNELKEYIAETYKIDKNNIIIN